MIPQWLGDCFWNSNNVMMNMAASNSAAWACMGWTSMPMNSFSPYMNFGTGYEALTNPWFAWCQAGNTLFGGGNGAYNWQMPYTDGWNFNTNTQNNANKTKKDDELSPEEKLYKEKYNRLKTLLDKYADNLKKSSAEADVVNGDIIKGLIKKSDKTTWKEKYEELKAIYDNPEYIDKTEIRDYIISNSTTQLTYGLGTTKQVINKWLKEAGYQEFATDYEELATAIKNDIDNLCNKDPNIDTTNITSDKVLGMLSCYNTTNSEDFATALVKKYKNLTNDEDNAKDTATGGIQSIVNALKTKAETLKNSANLDSDTKTAITTAISELSGQIDVTSEHKSLKNPDEFIAAFNKLYALTRLAAAAIAEKSLKDQYSFDTTIAAYVTEQTKADLEGEKLAKVTISDLKVKYVESNKKVIKSDNTNDINKKSNEDKITTLVDAGAIEAVEGATCEDKQLYITTYGTKRWVIMKDDGKFYEVVNTDGVYTVKADATAIEASTIKTEKEKIDARATAEAELVNNDKVNLTKETTEYTMNGKKCNVYSVEFGGKKHYYILNNDNKLEEVTVSDTTVTKKSGANALTLSELKETIKSEEKRVLEANHEQKIANISLTENSEEYVKVFNNISISQGSWADKAGKFENSIANTIDKLFVWNADCGYTKNEFNAAKKSLVSYYKGAFQALEKVRWNQSAKDGVEASIKLDDDALLLGETSFEYKKYSYNNGRLQTETKTEENVENTQSSCLIRTYTNDSLKCAGYLQEARTQTSPTGMYVVCLYTLLAQNSFTIDIDTSVMLEKFKSFLP